MLYTAIILLIVVRKSLCEEPFVHTCFSNIYCYGPLLHTVQMAKESGCDSKYFVDIKLKKSPNETFAKFTEFMKQHKNKPSDKSVRQFVYENFEAANQEFEEWTPPDWTEFPKFLDSIKDEKYKKWAVSLNSVWKELGRKMKADVEKNKDLYSIIWVPNAVIVPGGRFREFYYWDSYWIIRGLLLSEMYTTAKGMLENFLYMVDNYGHVPNGGRIYYLQRSQPPLLIPMMKSYLDFTGDVDFIKKNLKIMEKEFEYWINNHTVSVDVKGSRCTLAVYGENATGPRPESYTEDVKAASFFEEQKKDLFYFELKAAAESGWDFSSRWFIKKGTNVGNVTDTKTKSIIPVDLNAILYWNAVLLSEFNNLASHFEKAQHYTDIATDWFMAVTKVLWHGDIGAWLDYDMLNSKRREYFYPSNLFPLWTGCYDTSVKFEIVASVLKYLENSNATKFPGGIPTSLTLTGQQWDFPNAWPPLQYIVIVGLNSTGVKEAQDLAFKLAEKWIKANYRGYQNSSGMYEKYDARVPGLYGGGGEYDIQLGFGWTNGIILDLLNRYSSRLEAEEEKKKNTIATEESSNGSSQPHICRFVLVAFSVAFVLTRS